jgi:glycosyltransferase involved in cell wall biosynthesis
VGNEWKSGRMSGPVVSIILPTYNRARFLLRAFASIESQTCRDWELIVVDDGSTDETRQLVSSWSETVRQSVRYYYQENQGAYGARNMGLDQARGEHVAFFDSDDQWLPHHLRNCVDGLIANPAVDWVYGACRIVDDATDNELVPNTFYTDGRPRPFLRLQRRTLGGLHVIDDAEVMQCAILHGLYCGLQNSVIRRAVFRDMRFDAAGRNEAEDQLVVLRSLARGVRFAYFDDVHVVYRVHEANSSASAVGQSVVKRARIMEALLRGYENLRSQISLTPSQQRALNRRLGSEYFWRYGYATLWQNGQRREALRMFRRGISFWPSNPVFWKTYVVAWLKYGLKSILA